MDHQLQAWLNDTKRVGVKKVFVLHTGGTIGSLVDPGKRSVKFDPTFLRKRIADSKFLSDLNDKAKASKLFDCEKKPFLLKTTVSFDEIHPEIAAIAYYLQEYEPQILSEDLVEEDWRRMVSTITSVYNDFDGIVILHGTNTLACSASMFSFVLQNLDKPIILTGSMIPMFEEDSDGRENLYGAILTAGTCPWLNEVAVYFARKCMRGNCTTKVMAASKDAFQTPNVDLLGEFVEGRIVQNQNFKADLHPFHGQVWCFGMGIFSEIFRTFLFQLRVNFEMNPNICVIHFFPFITVDMIQKLLSAPCVGAVLACYGMCVVPKSHDDIRNEIRRAVGRDVIIVAVTQCLHPEKIDPIAKADLQSLGVISAGFMTTESAVTKLAHVLGQKHVSLEEKKRLMQHDLVGEFGRNKP